MTTTERTSPVLWRGFILLAVLVMLVDFNTLPGTFVGDDVPIVAGNPRVATMDIRAIFTTDYWGQGENSGLYRPLTLLTFAVDRRLFGARPGPHHVVNVLLHTGAVLLFARTLVALGFAFPLAWTAAALFAAHPIHADSVSILVGRAELLVALFVFLGLWASRTPGRRGWPLVLGSYAAALLSKEHAIAFMPLMALVDGFAGIPCGERLRKRLPLYALLLIITGGWLLLRQWISLSSGVGPQVIYPVDNPLVTAPLLERMFTAIRVNLDSMLSLILPLRLQSTYSGPGLPVVPGPLTLWGGIALGYAALLAAVTVHGWRRRAGHGLGIPFFIIAFAATSNLFVLIAVLRADRFAYLPSAGFCLAAASLLLATTGRLRRTPLGATASLLPTACILALSLLTVGRNKLFQDPARLWESAIHLDPGNARAWSSLAQVRLMEGRVDQAEQALRATVAADPSFPDGYAAYAVFLLEQRRFAEAELVASKGNALLPGAIGLGHLALARAKLELGRPAEALTLLDEIITRFGKWPVYWKSLGRAREGTGEAEAAVQAYQRALLLGEDRDTSWRLAALLLRLGRSIDVEEVLRPLIESSATAAEHNLLGVALALQGRREEARIAFAEAIRLDPSSAKYRENLERAKEP